MKRLILNAAGFTLIEIVMVMVVLAVLAGMSVPLLTQGLNTFSSGENIVSANWQGQIAMNRMARDIPLVRSPADIPTITASNFAFTDIYNNAISYSLIGTNLTLTQNGSSQILANGIQSVTFTYFDRSGASTTIASSVCYVGVNINVAQNNVNYSLRNLFYLRNAS